MSTQILHFNNHRIESIEIDGKKYISSANMSNALEYSTSKSITNLFNSNREEFTEGEDYMVIDSMTVKNAPYKQIFFSMEGVILITMLAKTQKAVEFRKWAKNTLANLPQIKQLSRMEILQIAMESEKRVLELESTVKEKDIIIEAKDTQIEVQDATIDKISNIQDTYSIRQAKSNLLTRECSLKQYLFSKKWCQYLSNGKSGVDKKNILQATYYAVTNNFAKDVNVENRIQQRFFKQFRITKHGMAFLIKHRNEYAK